MSNIKATLELLHQSKTGIVPISGSLENAQELMGLSFGVHFNSGGQISEPGSVNDALAKYIVNDEILRSKNMTLQEELAIAVERHEPRMSMQIDSIRSVKKPFRTFNTHELITKAKAGLIERNVRSLAVVAFRHHLPRAAAQVKKAGFDVAVPDMSGIGDFDPYSSQPWIRNINAWTNRERKVIAVFALMGRV